MRLAIVRRRFNPFGGAERFIVEAARALIERGTEVTVVTEAWEGGEVPGLSHLIIRRRGRLRHQRARAFQNGVAEAVASHRFDLVQTHERLLTADLFRAGDGVHAAWVARLAAERRGLSRVFLGLDPLHRLIIDTERRMARETDMLFVANSPLVAEELADHLALPSNRIRIIENGVDLARFRPPSAGERQAARQALGLAADAPLVAFVGSGFERKGAFRLLDALALPAARHIHAVVAGADRALDRLRRRAAAPPLSGRVTVLGGVADVRPVLAAADLFALPSLYDPLPNAALEAIACGLPVLVTRDTGIAEAVASSGAGLVLSRDPEDLAAGLDRCLSRIGAMRQAAVALAPRYDLAAATGAWRALYDELT